MRSYLRYCILALSIFILLWHLWQFKLFVMVNFIVLCLLTLTLWIEFSFHVEPWLIHSLWIGIVHGILFDISGWYHNIWWILYTCKVIKGNTCAYLGLLGVACSPFFISELRRGGLWACSQLSSYSWWGCEYNMHRLLTKLYFQLTGKKLMYLSYTTVGQGLQ